MHGLINRSIEGFLRGTYGDAFWLSVAESAGIDTRGFQTMRNYPDAISHSLINHAALIRNNPEAELLEDLGAWLAQIEPVRRLLRFSGRDFQEFLFSLEELPGRAHMVIPDLGMPRIRVVPRTGDEVLVTVTGCFPEWRFVMAGLIRAMADDYGALGLILVENDSLIVRISDDAFAEGRKFDLGAFGGPAAAGAI